MPLAKRRENNIHKINVKTSKFNSDGVKCQNANSEFNKNVSLTIKECFFTQMLG